MYNKKSMSNYLDLLIQQDKSSRTNYSFDPRVQMQATRGFTTVEPFSNTPPVSSYTYTGQPEGSHSDASIVQESPLTKAVKRYVVMDASQRDWVKQPNPFSNLIFTFGAQNTGGSNPAVYTNNPFIPTFADQQQALPAPLPGAPNVSGWSLSNVSYPGYNSSLPSGNFIAFDTGYTIAASGSGFGSVFTPCNVASLRLVRAVMPQRQFSDIPLVPNPDGTLTTISSNIQATLANTTFSTFSTYPYLMLYLNEYFGQYVGGNEPTRRSFSVMTQKQRQQQTFTANGLGVQQFDYEPWGEEALRLQSPITNLQRIQISVSDPIGNIFIHTDTLSVSLMQTDSNGMYINCFTPNLQYFSGNEIRVGDRIVFYGPTISNMMKSSYLAVQNTDKQNFVRALLTGTFTVLSLLDYVPDASGIYGPRDSADPPQPHTTPYVSSYNGFSIPNFFAVGDQGSVTPLYPQSIDGYGTGASNATYTILEPNSLVGSNLEFMNASLQPVYTLELDVLQPDTGAIGGKIVL
jgi:hypothetical protein